MAMGTGASGDSLRGPRDRNRPKSRLRGRQSRPRPLRLEGLEERMLLLTIPAASPTGDPINLSAMMGNIGGATQSSISSTQVVVDPHDPSKLVAVWMVNDPVMAAITSPATIVTAVEAAYTIDGGQKWNALFSEPTNTAGLPTAPRLLDPLTNDPIYPYPYQTSPSVAFDNNDNFYILDEYSTSSGPNSVAGSTSGAVVLQRYDFSGTTPNAYQFTNNQQDPGTGFFGNGNNVKVIYQWLSDSNNDQAINPTLSVDGNQATLPPSVSSAVDPNSGNVYVAWTSIDTPEVNEILNPYRIKMVASSDGGNNFGPITIASVNTSITRPNWTPGADNSIIDDPNFNPGMTVLQGRSPSESGLSGDPGIPGGTVTISWDDAATNTLLANTVTPGHNSTFGQQSNHTIPLDQSDTRDFQVPVNVSNLTDLTSLSVRVYIFNPNNQYLGLVLIAPGGQSITLQQPGQLAGAGEGYTDNGFLLGTIFDDIAHRPVGLDQGTNETAPYIGDYRAIGGTLRQFLLSLNGNINGTWTLETNDTNTSTSATPGVMLDWSISFGRGLTPDNYVTIPGTNGLVLPIDTTVRRRPSSRRRWPRSAPMW